MWCRFDHSAQESNQAYRRRRDDYYTSNQCYDLSVWFERKEWYDNRVCYNCGFEGHIAVNCQSKRFETRKCYNCQIKGHVARDYPMNSKRRSRVESH
ncbi:putative transcription factor interactor and regulator CCHC(Zn) family [Helianthus anomalus]